MEIKLGTVASELGTRYFIVSFSIVDGSLLHCEMKMALRNEWLPKPILNMSRAEVKVEVVKQLVNYLKGIVGYDADLTNSISFSSDFDLTIGG